MTDISRARALEVASVPTLLMCLAQLTGEQRWLEAPYLPQRDTELFADESGGLPEEVQDEIRAAISSVLAELETGVRALPPEPDSAQLTRMMCVCVGEEVGAEYAPMFLEEMGIEDRDVHWSASSGPGAGESMTVLIVGGGLSGILAAVKLGRLGMPYQIVEKNADLGGTWYENDYPECGVDTPNHFYSYSFAPKQDWQRYFSKRAEILEYLHAVADRDELRANTLFEHEVTHLDWDEPNAQWRITTKGPDGRSTRTASAVICAVGQLNRPKTATVPGIESFPGPVFHSAQWRHDVALAGQRVAVVGTGASAVQLLRSVVADSAEVTVFQRSPQWVKPSRDYHSVVSDETIWCLRHIPYYERWYRFQLFWRFGDGLLGGLRRDPDWPFPQRAVNQRNDRHRRQMLAYIEQQLDGRPDLLAKATPDYPPYAKRILVDNDWYATLRRENVSLVTDAVDRVEGSSLVTAAGERHEADVLILATGFEAGKMLSPMTIRGRSGRALHEVWGDDDPRAYLGLTVPDYPNLFCLYGPNTNLAHGGSVVFQAECQVRFITSCLRTMVEDDIAALEVREEVHDMYNLQVDEEHSQLVWTHPGVESWYRNARGRVFSPMPWRMVDYWSMTHDVDLTDYHLVWAGDRVQRSRPRAS